MKSLQQVDPGGLPLELLQNPGLPEHTLLQSYDFELYKRALLYSKESPINPALLWQISFIMDGKGYQRRLRCHFKPLHLLI
ncbi:hypothetical protein PAXRUDRAFT_19705 [Paxillus rubicundulus Ve08.2h10]|uniref:Uncharacterized protein n=1 Tax=Paxillus rubicundulus Ve08.2h10 TaxID=930991 RepID=A0A0D0CU40_9AGAM|nr:hypothetical protein PAXRUDRAFT_19705 [Paxillus rubicundulus Ve08.2h10]